MKRLQRLLIVLLWMNAMLVPALAQFTPSQDAFTDSSKPTINFGAATTLGVENSAAAIQTTYIQFDLSSIPAGFNGSNVAKATLKLFVNSVGTAGNLNVDFINGTWAEKTLNANNAPPLGGAIASGIPLATTNKNDYLLIDVTSAVQAWLNGTEANNGLALVADSPLASTFDSKENAAQSHTAELDIVFNGAITGVDTASGSGLTGGGASGTLNLSLLKTCSSSQVLQWNGSSWACSNAGTGTITGVTAGTDLTGGGSGGNVTLNLDTTKVAQLNAANTFTGSQTINGNLSATNLTATSVVFGQLGSFTASTAGNILIAQNQNTSGGIGIVGNSSGTSGIGMEGNAFASGGTGVQGNGATGVAGTASTSFGTGVLGTSASGTGVLGQGTGSGSIGVFGKGQTEGLVAFALAASGNTQGVFAAASSPTGTGTFSLGGGESKTGQALAGCCPVGVWGDTNQTSSGAAGLVGTADDAQALFLQNNSTTHLTANINNVETTAHNVEIVNIQGAFGSCSADTDGDLNCTGRISSHNVSDVFSSSTLVNASSLPCTGVLTSANSQCDTPGMLVTVTTRIVPVFIMANLNGVAFAACVVPNFALVMDGNIIAASNLQNFNSHSITTSLTLVSLQFPAAGNHTFEVQESDDNSACGLGGARTQVGLPSNASASNFSTRTLIVREF